jgi:hypothetical protein
MDEESGEIEVIGSRAELRERAVDKAKLDAVPELHRPWIDDIQILSRDGQRVLKRVPKWATPGSTRASCRFQPSASTAPKISVCQS